MTRQTKDHASLTPKQRDALQRLSRRLEPCFIGDVFSTHVVMRALERRGLVDRGPYRHHHQPPGQTWRITDAGRRLLAVPAPALAEVWS